MFSLSKGSFNIRCQSCGAETKLFTLKVENSHKQGTEISLCKDCCDTLRNLLSATHLDDVKMVSCDELDKIN